MQARVPLHILIACNKIVFADNFMCIYHVGSSTGATGGTFLGSIAATFVNTGQIAISPPWEVTMVGSDYQVKSLSKTPCLSHLS